jgi:hypothetical protein
MEMVKLCVSVLLVGVTLVGCSPAAAPATSTPFPPTQQPVSPTATEAPPTSVPTTAPTAEPTAAATEQTAALDPCQVVPLQEASDLVGVTLEAGREAPYPDGSQGCLYAAVSSNVLTVEVYQAPDVATADTHRDAFMDGLSGLEENAIGQSIEPTKVPDFADGAIEGEMHFTNMGVTMNGSAFAFVKGTTCVGIMDIAQDSDAPSLDALKAEATKALDRIP